MESAVAKATTIGTIVIISPASIEKWLGLHWGKHEAHWFTYHFFSDGYNIRAKKKAPAPKPALINLKGKEKVVAEWPDRCLDERAMECKMFYKFCRLTHPSQDAQLG